MPWRAIVAMLTIVDDALDGLDPGRNILRRHFGHGHHIRVHSLSVVPDRIDGQRVIDTEVSFRQPAQIGRHNWNSSGHGLQNNP